jgi:drug/metabolite transporter (DMT)-like permease
MGEALGTFLFTASYHNINPSIAILLQKVQPIFAVLAARVILKEKANRHFYWWAALALVAGTMVSLPDLWKWTEVATGFPSLRMSDNARNLGILQALGAAFVWGLSTVFGKWVTTQISFPVTAFLRFAWGLVGMGLIALSRLGDMSPSFATQLGTILTTPEHLRAILYIALIPGVLAMNLYYAGLTTTKASAATFAELFFPVAAVAINWVLLDQALSGPQLFGGALLLVAVYFINKQNQRKHKK